MTTIRSQVIASTGLDSHGDEIPRDALEEMFQEIPDPWLMFDNHDQSKPPIARAYNKQFLQLDDGNWAICADVEILDESKLDSYGGFSISFSRSTYTVNPDREPEITIGYNPRLFSKDEIIELCHASTDDFQIDAKDVNQKAAIDHPIILFLMFASAAIFTSFFNKLGADLYVLLKQKIADFSKKSEKEHGKELSCHMTFTFDRSGQSTEVLVSVKAADLDYLEDNGLGAQFIISHINEVIGDARARKVVMKASRDGPLVTIDYFIDESENYHAIEKHA